MAFRTDEEAHMRAKKRFIASLAIVFGCWGACWWYSWEAAALAMAANAYMVAAFAFGVYAAHPREE